jgi:hypothetical protein
MVTAFEVSNASTLVTETTILVVGPVIAVASIPLAPVTAWVTFAPSWSALLPGWVPKSVAAIVSVDFHGYPSSSFLHVAGSPPRRALFSRFNIVAWVSFLPQVEGIVPEIPRFPLRSMMTALTMLP